MHCLVDASVCTPFLSKIQINFVSIHGIISLNRVVVVIIIIIIIIQLDILTAVRVIAPQTCLHLVVVVGLLRLGSAGGSLTTSRATHAGKVKG
jgi:hypothetical protein